VVEAGHGANTTLLKRSDDAREVIRIHPHVAVRHNDHIMLDVSPHVDKIRDLAVQAVHRCVDDEIKMTVLIFRPKLLNDGNRVVSRVLHAENDLNGARIVLSAENEARFSNSPDSAPCNGLRIVTLGIDAPGAGKALRGKRLVKNVAQTRQAQRPRKRAQR